MFVNSEINTDYKECNPTISLMELRTSKENYAFPDPNKYFILSDAGRYYSQISNDALLVNPNRGYYTPRFSIDYNNPTIISLAKSLFVGAEPISGIAKTALELAIKKVGKENPSLPNRL